MTREEAKDYIREWCPYDRQEEIIKALEQEPCEDVISRKALLEEIENGIKAGNYEEGYEEYPHINDMDDIIECIKYADSIQPKPKTDEPMQVDLEGDGYADGELVYDYGKCPKCGWDFEYGDKDWEEPYCCHCGQKLHWFESEDKE